MNENAYEVLSMAMRYVFTFFGVMIVWRAFSWLRKDRKTRHRRLKQLPDAGTIGILTVLEGGRHLREGAVLSVPHEGVMGYLRTCDVVVPVDGVADIHADFAFADGEGLYVYPWRGCDASVDGVPLVNRKISRQHPMQHGSILQMGQAVLQLGVFAGLDVQEARFVPDDWNDGDDLTQSDQPWSAEPQWLDAPQWDGGPWDAIPPEQEGGGPYDQP